MDIEILARFSKDVPKTEEEAHDDYVNELIGKALTHTKTVKYIYDPVVFSSDSIYSFVRLDSKHTQIMLDSDTYYNAFIPYEQWLSIYQQVTGKVVMKISYSDAPMPKKRGSVKE